jgi:hypothetical protein
MLTQPDSSVSAAMEECVDDIDDFITTLDHYPEVVIALALRVHLGALLRALVEQRSCTRADVRHFVLELEQEALGVGEE